MLSRKFPSTVWGNYMDSVSDRQQGMEDFAKKTAAVVGSTAGYLQTRDVQQMMDDVESAARRNPMPALITAAALGVLIGAILRRG